jgi:hypothetical protein
MYIVTQVFPNAIEIWDGVTKDEKKQPTGQMTLFVDNAGDFRVDDVVQLSVKPFEIKMNDPYAEEPEGRSGVRTYGTFRPLGDNL